MWDVCAPPQLVEMARRLFLIGVMVLVMRGSVTQLVIATVMCAVYLLLQTEASPFEDIGGGSRCGLICRPPCGIEAIPRGAGISSRFLADNFLASSCSFALVIFFVCCIMFKLATLTELRELQERMSVEQREVHILLMRSSRLAAAMHSCCCYAQVVDSIVLDRARFDLDRTLRFHRRCSRASYLRR
jgi:hypothetical protein